MQNTSVRPIFIVGAPRSGTTLFQYMLRSHPNISLPTGESHFFIPFFREETNYGDLNQPENVQRLLRTIYANPKRAHFFETDLHGIRFNIDQLTEEFVAEGRTTMAAIFGGILEKNATGEGKARWGDKTPYYVLHMPMLLDRFPGAQFLHVIRDGRDVALSLFGRRHDFGVYNTYFAAKYWEIYVQRGQEAGCGLGPDVYHEVRYEDLLKDPETMMQRVCKFLGEGYSESLVDFKKSGEAGKTPLLQRPIQESNREKWRSKMTSRQLEVFEGAVAKTLARNGYPLITEGRQIPLPTRALYRFHNQILLKWHHWRVRR